jgi:hypothetical protein
MAVMTMDQAVELLNTFIARESEAEKVIWTSTDKAAMETARGELEALFGGGLRSEVNVPWVLDDDHLQQGEKQLQVIGPRHLFKVERYEHGELGTLFRAYAGSHLRKSTTYASSLFAADLGQGPRLVSQYNLCRTCRGSGQAGGKKCSDCGGTGWRLVGGTDLGDLRELGEPVEVRKIQPPSDPDHLADYEAR